MGDAERYAVSLGPHLETTMLSGHEDVIVCAMQAGVTELVFSANALRIEGGRVNDVPVVAGGKTMQ